jgi:SAM-dependent methyltransferase
VTDSDNFYIKLLDHFGHSPKTVGWESLESQQARFQALADATNWEGKHVLDVGCGLGDLYDFIKRNYPKTAYTGFDELTPLIEQAKRAYPSGHFICESLADFPKEKKFDCVVCSGAFNFRQKEDQFAFLHRQVEALMGLTSDVMALSLLSDEMYKDESFHYSLFYYDREAVKTCLSDLGDVTLMDGYLVNDFTVSIRI